MTARSWGELGRFSILLVLCGLLLSVPAILLRPLESSAQLDRDEMTIGSMSAATVRGEARKTSDPKVRAVYRLNDGSTVVFVKTALYRDELELAVGFSKDGALFDIRHSNELMAPSSAKPWYLRNFVLSDAVRGKILGSSASLDAGDIEALSGASFDLNRYVAAVRAASQAAKEAK